MVRKELTDRARDFNIILDDVAITELAFGKEYTAAVESKQVSGGGKEMGEGERGRGEWRETEKNRDGCVMS